MPGPCHQAILAGAAEQLVVTGLRREEVVAQRPIGVVVPCAELTGVVPLIRVDLVRHDRVAVSERVVAGSELAVDGDAFRRAGADAVGDGQVIGAVPRVQLDLEITGGRAQHLK